MLLSRRRIMGFAREPAESASSPAAAALASFFALCENVDSLRKFAFLNFVAVTKIIKKHDKNSFIRLRDALTAYVEAQPICSSVQLLELSQRSQALLAELFASVPDAENDDEPTCTICRAVISEPVVLGCSHRFCGDCAGKVGSARGAACGATWPCGGCGAALPLRTLRHSPAQPRAPQPRGRANGCPTAAAAQRTARARARGTLALRARHTPAVIRPGARRASPPAPRRRRRGRCTPAGARFAPSARARRRAPCRAPPT